MPRQVLVVNSTYEPINVCSCRRAVVLVLKGKAEALETGPELLRSERSVLPMPVVVRLLSFVRIPHAGRRRISRRVVMARDGYRCQYCGSTRHLTLDHVVPRSRGGSSSWDNIVTSCAPCNVRKGASLPSEADMRLIAKPRPPVPADFLVTGPQGIPQSWVPYLFPAVA